MYQPYPSSGQLTGPLRPSAPPVRTAVTFMYAGAAVSIVNLIIALTLLGDTKAYHLRWNGHSLTAAQISDWRPLIITVTIVFFPLVPALWLWMARANGRGRNWARVLSTVLFGVATLDLTSVFGPAGIHLSLAPAAADWITVLTWLAGLAAVWLLWRPDSTAFFKPKGVV
jgi:hypothetical protein